MKYLYVVITATLTKFGKVIRRFGKVDYNHCAIAFDEELNDWYSFARRRHKAVLTGGLMKEHIRRYTLDTDKAVNCIIFRIPVTESKYRELRQTVDNIGTDSQYIYNLLSVLTYPVTKGIVTKKAFTCTEFTVYMLMCAGFNFRKPICTYKPDDLVKILRPFAYFKGDLAGYVKTGHFCQTDYFNDISQRDVMESIRNVARMIRRLPMSRAGNM
ncbi:MAG: hypothetical protein ILP19_07345 [Oscillospiraceae bacterium]|nr:hypothetical protein [Oscillospiraceae bacterium]